MATTEDWAKLETAAQAWGHSRCILDLRRRVEALEQRAARRSKPPSLKEQALAALDRQERGRDRGCLRPEAMADADTIRRALEALNDD